MARGVEQATEELIASRRETLGVATPPMGEVGNPIKDITEVVSEPEPPAQVAVADAQAVESMATDTMTDVIPESEGSPNRQYASAKNVVGKIINGVQETVRKIERGGEEALGRQRIVPEAPAISKVEGGYLVKAIDPQEMDDIKNAIPGYDGKSINFLRFDKTIGVDGAQFFNDVKNANKDAIEAARRGTIPINDLIASADAIGMGDLISKFAMRQPGQPLPLAEDVVAGILAMKNIQSEISRLGQKAAASGTDEDNRKVLEAMGLARQLVQGISGVVSETGRTLGAVGNLASETGVSISRQAQDIELVMRRFEATNDVRIVNDFFGKLETADQKTAFLRGNWWDKLKEGTGKAYDVVLEGYINALLSGPQTHIVNIASNAMFGAWNIGERYAAAGIGWMRTLGGYTGGERYTLAEANAYAFGNIESFKDALKISAASFVRDAPLTGTATKLEIGRTKALSADNLGISPEHPVGKAVDFLGTVNRLPGRFLIAEDEFFKTVAYRATLNESAMREAQSVYFRALENGATKADAQRQSTQAFSDFVSNPPQALQTEAIEASKRMTFQKELPEILKKAETIANFPLLKFEIPFFRTPANLTIETLRRTPLNPDAYAELTKALTNRGTRESDLVLARFGMGSAAMATFGSIAYGLDKPGFFITGSPPKDFEERQRDERLGIRPFSFVQQQEDGSYRSISYARFDPISGLLAMSADYARFSKEVEWKEDNLENIMTVATTAVIPIMKYMGEQPMLQGMADITKLIDQFKKDDDFDRFERAVEMLVGGVTTGAISTVPGFGSFTATIERATDPRATETFVPSVVSENPAARGFYRAIDAAMARTPLGSGEATPKLSIWGDTITTGEGGLAEALRPVRIGKGKFNAVDEELRRLDVGLLPPKRDMGIGVPINSEQYNSWIMMANNMDAAGNLPGDPGYTRGETLLDQLNELISSESYKEASAQKQEEKIRRVYNGMYNRAKKMLAEELYISEPSFRKRLETEDPDLARKMEERMRSR
jgi:hypothetical protein